MMKCNMKKRSIELSLEEGQIVFQSLAEFPFKMVYELIGNINKQSGNRIVTGGQIDDRIELELTDQEMQTILRALEKRPFADVHVLINKFNSRFHKVG